VPLRSVEAASRDDAIAAAREQFGPQARVVGVRRVRSGGVLGFFATERYIAEVAELAADPVARPAVPSRTPADDAAPADFSSPLG
jgi:flagellar biosynthesis GTPase FlhF